MQSRAAFPFIVVTIVALAVIVGTIVVFVSRPSTLKVSKNVNDPLTMRSRIT